MNEGQKTTVTQHAIVKRESNATHQTGRRTTLRAGLEEAYENVHARIPEPVERALRDSGVVHWNIWRDGRFLYHSIETTDGYEAMVEAITSLGPIDLEWDELIASLLEQSPGADVVLPRVWSMDPRGQS
jgi:L-rhamnose mutarotase